jgi:hypothetical protein
MALTVVDIYNVRFGNKLALPRSVQDKISKLRITPVAYKPVRSFVRNVHRQRSTAAAVSENWREKALVEMVRRDRERVDPEFKDIFSIINKITMPSVDKLSHDMIEIIQKQDEQFRLRVTTLLFDKAIVLGSYSKVMAECAYRLNIEIPEITDDLQAQIAMFPKLYDMTDTITYPEAADPQFDDKVVAWTSQKNKRRGYARFMMELFAKELIPESLVRNAFEQVMRELNESARYPSSELTTENTTQFVEFVFECSKIAKGDYRDCVRTAIQEMLSVPKEQFKATYPSMNMKSKFKLEDALKLVEKKE